VFLFSFFKGYVVFYKGKTKEVIYPRFIFRFFKQPLSNCFRPLDSNSFIVLTYLASDRERELMLYFLSDWKVLNHQAEGDVGDLLSKDYRYWSWQKLRLKKG